MSSSSEKTFGARLANARTISALIDSLNFYQPSDSVLNKESYAALISRVETKNESVAVNRQSHSTYVDIRQQLFQKGIDSVRNLMTPILAGVRSGFGKTSKQAAYTKAITTKIVGPASKKKTTEPKAKTVSQSERGYGSVTQTFSELITTLHNYGDAYSPGDDKIKISNLKDKLQIIRNANRDVAEANGALSKARRERTDLYKTLSETTQRVKDHIKSQYRGTSVEYNIVKGLIV